MREKLAITCILVLCTGVGACKKGGGTATAAAGLLGPAAGVTTQLQKGLTAFVGGADVAKAFAPYEARARSSVAGRLKEAKVKSARLLGMELELLYYQGTDPVYYLRTFVHPSSKGPAFLSFQGREPSIDRRTGKRRIYVRGKPFAAFTGQAAGLAKAARNLAAALKAGRCADLKVADLGKLAEQLPERMRRRLKRGTEKTTRGLSEQCPKLAKLGFDRMLLRIDDFSALGLDGAGKAVGLIRGDLRLGAAGKLEVRIGSFRPFP